MKKAPLPSTAPILLWHAEADMHRDFVSENWSEFTGCPREQLLGNGWTNSIHPDDVERVLCDYRKANKSEKEIFVSYHLRHADGRYRQVADRANPCYRDRGIFAGYFGSCIDVEASLEVKTDEQAELDQLRREMKDLVLQLSYLRA